MDKNKITSNDVLEALSMRINDVLRPAKKDNKKNNAYFWMFKFALLVIYVVLINWLFTELSGLGVTIIYLVGKSLRSVLSAIWICSIAFMKALLITCLLYDNLKIFMESSYYGILYKDDKKMLPKKEKFFHVIEVIFKVIAAFLLLIMGFMAALSMFGLIYMIVMVINGMFMVSPIIIMGAVFVICYFTFKYIQSKFFNLKVVITKNHFIISFVALLVGICFFGYETSSFEYKNTLPVDFELIRKEATFKVEDNQLIKLKNNSKLNNMKILIDEELDGEIRVVFEYFETAKVKYSYEFNDNDDLKLLFSSDLDFGVENVYDVLKLFVSTFNNKTMYNYNLFKYPNIYVYVSKADMERIKVY